MWIKSELRSLNSSTFYYVVMECISQEDCFVFVYEMTVIDQMSVVTWDPVAMEI